MGQKTNTTRGYTIVELLIVIVVIGILSVLIFGGVINSQARARDTERATDIDVLRSRLEQYYNDNGGYPNTFSVSTFPAMDPATLKDPAGNTISIVAPVANQFTARATSNPTSSGAQYKYVPYPTGCGAITCTGYVLKTFIEQPSSKLPNPYVRYGLNNN